MTPEEILSAIVVHSQRLELEKPDPLVMENNPDRIGKRTPLNWRLLLRRDDPLDDGQEQKPRIELWPSVHSAEGRESLRRSRFSVSEVAAGALVGMPERNWQALQCAIGIGSTARGAIFARLHAMAIDSRKNEQYWPKKLRRRACACGRSASIDYMPDVVELAIKQLEHPMLFYTNQSRADWFGISDRHWYRVMLKPYDVVSAHLWHWYHSGIGHIQNRLNSRSKGRAQLK